ncbi:MAG: DUF4372 domain-containing protein [Deltaproteobacteria bacterium]|nr:DUF4372 domain-containing protein [Deltaproteobacteria bacterium]
MNSGGTIFAQLMDFVTIYEFRKCVAQYNGNYAEIYRVGNSTDGCFYGNGSFIVCPLFP